MTCIIVIVNLMKKIFYYKTAKIKLFKKISTKGNHSSTMFFFFIYNEYNTTDDVQSIYVFI